MTGKNDPRYDRPNPKHRAHEAACLPSRPVHAVGFLTLILAVVRMKLKAVRATFNYSGPSSAVTDQKARRHSSRRVFL
jgi:hypothetical protein